MPRGDRTGPAGMGPMTGRAAGFCAGYPVPGYMNPAGGGGYGGRGFQGGGFGRGRGFGWARAGYNWSGAVNPNVAPSVPTVTAEQELAGLKQRVEYFKDALGEINNRIEQIEAEGKK